MPKPRLVTGFPRYRDTELEIKARFILKSMKDNPYFIKPVPPLATVSDAISTYVNALRDVEVNGKAKAAIKNVERKILENLLIKLSLYVEAKANSNEDILLSSGFSLAKEYVPVGVLPKPHNFSISATETGTIILKLTMIYGAYTYQYEYRLANTQDAWTVQTATKASLKLKGLQSGLKYEFRVAGVGAGRDRIYSDIISSFVS